MDERISYGVTSDLNRIPTVWTESYSEALEDAKKYNKRYIIELTEHYEVCGDVEIT